MVPKRLVTPLAIAHLAQRRIRARLRFWRPAAIGRTVQGWATATRYPLPSAAPASLFPELCDTLVSVAATQDGSIMGDSGLYKLALVSAIAKLSHATRLVEIGTASGFMARHLVLNCGPRSQLWTIDLPQGAVPHFELLEEDWAVVKGNIRHHDGPGWYARLCPERDQIVQVYSDSATYDFAGVELPLDFAYVDGAHGYENVLTDSINVLTRMRARGVVVWDDYYHFFPGVIRALGQINSIVPVTHLAETGLAVAITPPDWSDPSQHDRLERLRILLPAPPRDSLARP